MTRPTTMKMVIWPRRSMRRAICAMSGVRRFKCLALLEGLLLSVVGEFHPVHLDELCVMLPHPLQVGEGLLDVLRNGNLVLDEPLDLLEFVPHPGEAAPHPAQQVHLPLEHSLVLRGDLAVLLAEPVELAFQGRERPPKVGG